MIQPGDSVDEPTFQRPDSSPVSLGQLASGPVILVFLRHLS
jgi:hypothetical protein